MNGNIKCLRVKVLALFAIILVIPVVLSGCGSVSAEDVAKKAAQCSVVKRVDTFLNTIFRKDRITPAFPCRTPLFHLVYNHQAKSEGV